MKARLGFAVVAAFALTGIANAQVMTYSGYDEGVSAPGANTSAAEAAFLSATGSLNIIDFETALPPGVTLTGGTVLSTPPGSPQYWGSNVTTGGTYYLDFVGNVVFNFSAPIDTFSLIMGGLQGPNTISWVNSAGIQSYSVAPNGGNGGFAFFGFTDVGEAITSVTIGSPGDFDGLDNVRFGNSVLAAVPEPSTWAMMLIGFSAVGFSMRRRRKVTQGLPQVV